MGATVPPNHLKLDQILVLKPYGDLGILHIQSGAPPCAQVLLNDRKESHLLDPLTQIHTGNPIAPVLRGEPRKKMNIVWIPAE